MVFDKLNKWLCIVALVVIVASGAVWPVAAQSERSAAAAAEIRFQQLEKEVRRLTGQIEEQNFEIRRLREELARVMGDVDVRLNDLERGTEGSQTGGNQVEKNHQDNSISSGTPLRPSAPSVLLPPPPDSHGAQNMIQSRPQEDKRGSFQYTPPEQKQDQTQEQSLGTLRQSADGRVSAAPADSASLSYDRAYAFIKARDFENAAHAFEGFMAQYPQDKLMENAKYWYAETFYVRGDYDRAARVFAEGYQQYPKGTKAPSNLLKLGMSLSSMGKTDDACVAYMQLKKEYAKSSVPVLKRADTEMERIGCR